MCYTTGRFKTKEEIQTSCDNDLVKTQLENFDSREIKSLRGNGSLVYGEELQWKFYNFDLYETEERKQRKIGIRNETKRTVRVEDRSS